MFALNRLNLIQLFKYFRMRKMFESAVFSATSLSLMHKKIKMYVFIRFHFKTFVRLCHWIFSWSIVKFDYSTCLTRLVEHSKTRNSTSFTNFHRCINRSTIEMGKTFNKECRDTDFETNSICLLFKVWSKIIQKRNFTFDTRSFSNCVANYGGCQ